MLRHGQRGEEESRHDVFLSHSHLGANWVEELAKRLEDEHQIRPWLDRWRLIPGKPWQREMALGLEQAASCAVCLGQHTAAGWFQNEIEKALNKQAEDSDYRVIPVLLPDADAHLTGTLQETFISLNTWVDFGREPPDRAFHLLACGIKGIAPGRWTPPAAGDSPGKEIAEKLRQLQQLRHASLVDDNVALETQRKILDRLLDV